MSHPFSRRLSELACALFVGASILLHGGAAHAATFGPGDLIKLPDDGNPDTTEDSAVYYVGDDGKRYAFPNSQAYFTWYENFDSVKTVSLQEMASLMLGGNITYRPGTRLVKITSDPNVYAVEPGGVLRWVTSEEVARGLYGDAWNRRIDDIPDAFFFNYQIGSPLTAVSYPSGSVVKRASDGAYFLIEDGTKRKFDSEEARHAVRVQDAFVLSADGDLSAYPDGSVVSADNGTLGDTAQRHGADLPEVPTLSSKPFPTAYFSIGSNDVTLLQLRAASKRAFTIKSLVVRIEATTGTTPATGEADADVGGLIYNNNARPNFTRIRFRDSAGNEPFAAQEVVLDTQQDQVQTFTFNGDVQVPAGGEKQLSLVMHTNYLLPSGEGYKVTIVKSGTVVVDSSTGNPVSFQPEGDLVGPVLTSLNAALEVQSSDMPGKVTYVRGAKDAVIAGLSFKATTVAPNVITSLTVQGYVDSEGVGGFVPGTDNDNGAVLNVKDILPKVSLYDSAGAKLAGPVEVTATGKATFAGLHYTLSAGTTGTLFIRGDIPKELAVGEIADKVAFDVTDPAADVIVTDDKGAAVNVAGALTNGGTTPKNYASVEKTGRIAFSFAGSSGTAIVGREVLVGTLSADAKYDSYALKALTFNHVGMPLKSVASLRLEYQGADGSLSSQTLPFDGQRITFTSLPVLLTKDTTTILKLYAKLAPKELALSGEEMDFGIDLASDMQFTSLWTGDTYDVSSVGAGLPFIAQVTRSKLVVRYTGLQVAKSVAAPSGEIYRDAPIPVLRFVMQTEKEGGARVKKLVFRFDSQKVEVAPRTDPVSYYNSGALAKWASRGAVEVGDLYILYLAGKKSIGEDGDARVSYKVDGETSGTLTYEFKDGFEISLNPAQALELQLDLDMSVFSGQADFPFSVSLEGSDSFLWTDTTFGQYVPLKGADTLQFGASSTFTVKK